MHEPMSDPQAPTTEAGRALLADEWLTNPYGEAHDAMERAILAIEADARAAALDGLDGPGSRRFHDLLERERHDVAMMARNLSILYDDISGGLVSKPNTHAEEVIRLYYERIDREVAAALAEAAERVRALPPWGVGPDSIDRLAVLAILEER